MSKSWAFVALTVLAAASTSRATCDDIDQHLGIPSPMTGDLIVDLDNVDEIVCEELGDDDELLEEVPVDGGYTLTLKSSSSVRFVNLGFTVKSGTSMVFDMPTTNFGPNTEGHHRTNYRTAVVEVEEGASVTFMGDVVAKEVSNCLSVFMNSGNLEFKKTAHFQDGGNVFRVNTGTVKFRGDATFKDHTYLAVQNEESGFFRFSGDVVFDNNASNFDGAYGCGAANKGADTKIIFRGDAVFKNSDCGEGVAMYNEGTTNFYGKAYFTDNVFKDNGGAVSNLGGSMKFARAVRFTNNRAADYGGGIGVERGGTVTFKKSVTFDGNYADSGAAFAVLDEGSTLTFEKPSVVRYRNGETFDDQYSDDDNCLFGHVGEGAVVVGFDADEICIPAA